MRAYIRPAEFLLYVGACKNDIQQKSDPPPGFARRRSAAGYRAGFSLRSSRLFLLTICGSIILVMEFASPGLSGATAVASHG